MSPLQRLQRVHAFLTRQAHPKGCFYALKDFTGQHRLNPNRSYALHIAMPAQWQQAGISLADHTAQ